MPNVVAEGVGGAAPVDTVGAPDCLCHLLVALRDSVVAPPVEPLAFQVDKFCSQGERKESISICPHKCS